MFIHFTIIFKYFCYINIIKYTDTYTYEFVYTYTIYPHKYVLKIYLL